ncbi:alkaline phosphatase family protein [Bacillus sp. Marseille-Q3570]|uniref:alkaline phosphatase family protein n=1 Tax=Bacillus sp. Marseille-Q3570 TaxID=2963522 RepID=UPI0021B70AEE|nr:alkaline phosphatase family protein [Bacillus sp. Marseille-Q3570]
MVKRSLLIISILLIIFATYVFGFATSPNAFEKNSNGSSSKPVVLLLVDSLMEKPLQQAIRKGKAPAMEFLIEKGQLQSGVITSYPTMSVTIDSTLLTGTYPNEHEVPGLVWFDEDENRLINYGSGKGEIFRIGVNQVVEDGLINLNQNHLNGATQTLYEELSNNEKDSASINGLVFRGKHEHVLQIPQFAQIFNMIPKNTIVTGPPVLSLGAVSYHNPENRLNNNVWQAMGFNDKFSAKELEHLIKSDQLPDFTLAYFSDMDQALHEKGPMDLEGIAKFDEQLQSILNVYDSWDEAIEKVTWLVYGDSAQSKIKDEKQDALIKLRDLLKKFDIWEIGSPIVKNDQIVLAVNERMAYIYLKDQQVSIEDVVTELKKDERISFIAWKNERKNHVIAPGSDKTLTFAPGSNFIDDYEQSWELDGDFSVMDLKVKDGRKIYYGDYPDGLARLYGALHSHEGRFIIVDARPGYEFVDSHTPTHIGGGGHGSLHKADSVTPLIITGTSKAPQFDRVIDFKEWILSITK